jgi:hypothetical protein
MRHSQGPHRPPPGTYGSASGAPLNRHSLGPPPATAEGYKRTMDQQYWALLIRLARVGRTPS